MARKLRPPPSIRSATDLLVWATDMGKWLYELFRQLGEAGVIGWENIDKTGSNVSDLTSRAHEDLTGVLPADTSSSTSDFDKHVSNLQSKRWEDHRNASTDVHGIGSGNVVVGTGTTQTLTNKTILLRYATTAVNLTLDSSHDVVKVTAACTITLPTASGVTGRVYIIDNAHTGSTTVSPTGAETIEGETSQTIYAHACMHVYSDGTNWRIL